MKQMGLAGLLITCTPCSKLVEVKFENLPDGEFLEICDRLKCEVCGKRPSSVTGFRPDTVSMSQMNFRR